MRTDFGYFEEKDIGKPYDIKMLKRLYPFAKPYKLLLFCSVFLVIFITLLDLSLPYVTKIAIDRYIVPVVNSDGNGARENQTDKTRYLKINLNDQKINMIVDKYKNQFHRYETYALISYDDLPKLALKDLLVLRKKDIAGLTFITVIFLAIVLVLQSLFC